MLPRDALPSCMVYMAGGGPRFVSKSLISYV